MQKVWEACEATARAKECGRASSAARGSNRKQSVAVNIFAAAGRKPKTRFTRQSFPRSSSQR
jgi:hypothetical protein